MFHAAILCCQPNASASAPASRRPPSRVTVTSNISIFSFYLRLPEVKLEIGYDQDSLFYHCGHADVLLHPLLKTPMLADHLKASVRAHL